MTIDWMIVTAAMAYRDALSQPVDPVSRYEVGCHYVYPYTDLYSGWRLIQEGKLTPWSWACSWLGAYQPVFSWDDPLPAVVEFSEKVRRFVQRSVRPRSSRGAETKRGAQTS